MHPDLVKHVTISLLCKFVYDQQEVKKNKCGKVL